MKKILLLIVVLMAFLIVAPVSAKKPECLHFRHSGCSYTHQSPFVPSQLMIGSDLETTYIIVPQTNILQDDIQEHPACGISGEFNLQEGSDGNCPYDPWSDGVFEWFYPTEEFAEMYD